MRIDRELTFKGSRTYLHSTTVFDDLLRLQGEPAGALDFRFDRRTDRQVRYQSDPPPAGGQVASWHDAAGGATIYVVEGDEPITRAVPYDEDGLASRLTFADRHVELPAHIDDYSLIEAIVAGYKALLLRTVAPGARLAFVRLRLSRMPALPLEIHFSRRIGEFFQGDIRADGQPVGQIFFGEWR